MKRAELRKLVAEYKEIKIKLNKSRNIKNIERLEEIKHKFYHETGETLESNLKKET
ncbi:MAG: hypothetical protein K5793_05080 [Nitrosarchaeum sp.]|nr:hypothetical protein [Nitrosarchaeum sp.]MCV0399465.1 hypothetical protein [Nitrosarchaeum sp.]